MMAFPAWILSICLTANVAMAADATADDRWMLTDGSLRSTAFTNVTLDGSNVAGKSTSGSATTALDQFVSLAREGATTTTLPAGTFVVHTADGQRWVGTPLSSTAETITWSTAALGERAIPLAAVVSIDHTLASPMTAEALQEDVATLANRDSVRGVVASIDAESLVMTVGDSITTVALANLAGVRFAATGQPEPTKAEYAITLIDGSHVFADALEVGGIWTVTISGDRLSLKPEQVVRVDHLTGPVRWLSELVPTVHYTPYLGESYPPQMDAAVAGGPIRFGDRTYERGIGVHARTILTYALDGAQKSFRTQYAADPAMTLTDAAVRVRVDDRVVHESRVRSGALSPVVWADLNGAKSLTLEVDFGTGLHAQDRVNWIEPALMKTPMATTSPAPE